MLTLDIYRICGLLPLILLASSHSLFDGKIPLSIFACIVLTTMIMFSNYTKHTSKPLNFKEFDKMALQEMHDYLISNMKLFKKSVSTFLFNKDHLVFIKAMSSINNLTNI